MASQPCSEDDLGAAQGSVSKCGKQLEKLSMQCSKIRGRHPEDSSRGLRQHSRAYNMGLDGGTNFAHGNLVTAPMGERDNLASG